MGENSSATYWPHETNCFSVLWDATSIVIPATSSKRATTSRHIVNIRFYAAKPYYITSCAVLTHQGTFEPEKVVPQGVIDVLMCYGSILASLSAFLCLYSAPRHS